MENSIDNLIPEQQHGSQTNTEHSVTANNREEALDLFKRAYKRLLNINIWHKLCGAASADFELKGAHGEIEHRLAEVNDHFKIDIPGPGTAAGDGFDWVRVESIEDKTNPDGEEEIFGMRVRSCSNPNNKEDGTAHFFTSDATSTFIIRRNANTVTVFIYGRNETPNTTAEKIADKFRNAAVGAGAIAGAAKIQWVLLAKGLLADGVPE